jgi:predicted ATPase
MVSGSRIVAFNGKVVRELAVQFLALAEKQSATAALMIGHRLMGISSLLAGGIAEGRAHLDQAMALYDPAEHRALATRFGQEAGVSIRSFRSMALWLLGYPEAALTDADHGLKDALHIGQAATLMLALTLARRTNIFCGNYAVANAQAGQLVALADEKGALLWKAAGMMDQGFLLALTGEARNAVEKITDAITAWRSTGSTLWTPLFLLFLARAYAEFDQFDDARRCIEEAMTSLKTNKEKWCESEVHRTAGEITLMSSERDVAKAEAHFEQALAVAREQQTKSWELRVAMSMARLWRDQGNRQQAHDLLAPVYGWFTQGFDTLDLKQAKALIDELR